MHVGVHTPPLYDRSFEAAVEYLSDLGVSAVEPGVGGHPGTTHVSPEEYLDEPDARAELRGVLDEHDVEISALATHNNPLHPDDDRASEADDDLRTAIELAGQLDVGTVTCFSGLPAGAPGDCTPNWITAPWPPEHAEALAYQWDVAVEYWSELAGHAREHDVDLAIEMHPNMLVHEPHGLEQLAGETDDCVGANFDPSHLYWQGIDVVEAIRFLGDRIKHVHAKDTGMYESNVRTKGVLDAKPYDDELERSWLFRTVGYGHGEAHWKDVVTALGMVGYDGALSIEHEDALASSREGLEKAVDVLQRAVFETEAGEAFWAE